MVAQNGRYFESGKNADLQVPLMEETLDRTR
jgi:hypothetical protein